MEDLEVRAQSRYVPGSPRKVRLVADLVRGMDAQEALGVLRLMPQRAASSVFKLIKSAIANAENNFGMVVDDLFIAHISADEAPVRRWRRRR